MIQHLKQLTKYLSDKELFLFMDPIPKNNAVNSIGENKSLILIDESESEENPILDLNSFRNAIVKIVKDSIPKFTIEIYGEWGTGKTTLMNHIKNSLDHDENITMIWFNAWRYER